jgi:hypothetical protein
VTGDDRAELVERGDLDELTRHVDRLCRQRRWDDLTDLRRRCRLAVVRGKQLWPVASHIEFRLALEAPGPWAASVLEPGAGRFALGPLAEVAASSHPWSDLAPFVVPTPAAAMAAHERVVRGEDLRADATAAGLPTVLDLPLALEPWEPSYAVARYSAERLDAPAPSLSAPSPAVLPGWPGPARPADDPLAVSALNELASTWVGESNGRTVAAAVHGSAGAAVAALGARSFHLVEVTPGDALALMAWAAASGGAHGRRRGSAAGRFGAWWAVAALGGLLADWPVPAGEIGDVLLALRWFAWDAGEPEVGWVLRLAVEDEDEGLAWAVAAVDVA